MAISWIEFWPLAAVIVTAGFVHGVTGLGSSFIVVSLLGLILPLGQAAGLATLVTMGSVLTVFVRHGTKISLRPVWRLMAGALTGIPVGVLLVSHLPALVVLRGFGIVVLAFCAFTLSRPSLPRLPIQSGYGFGFGSGTLGGAFNAGTPFLIAYGLSQGWGEREFKSHLTGYLMVNMCVLAAAHVSAGNLTLHAFGLFAAALPLLVAAVLLGMKIAPRIGAASLQRITLLLLGALGVKYLFAG
jgi:uncharacterized membrane protein YfcA